MTDLRTFSRLAGIAEVWPSSQSAGTGRPSAPPQETPRKSRMVGAPSTAFVRGLDHLFCAIANRPAERWHEGAFTHRPCAEDTKSPRASSPNHPLKVLQNTTPERPPNSPLAVAGPLRTRYSGAWPANATTTARVSPTPSSRAAGRVRGRPCGRRSGSRQDGDGDAGQRQPGAARHRPRRSTDDEHRSGSRPDRGPASAARRVAVGARGLEPRSSGRGRALGAWAVHPDRLGPCRADDGTRHTGAGRFTRLRMRPMSLFESGHSTGAISLRGLLDGEPQRGHAAPVPIARLAERIAVGGWPAHLGKCRDAGHARQPGLSGRHPTVPTFHALDGRSHDPVRVGPGSCSPWRATSPRRCRWQSWPPDVGGNGTAMKADTAAGYLDALERLMVVEHQPAWSPHLRSRTTLRSTPVRHFVDPSLAVAALGGRASPATLVADLEFFGFLFESIGHPRLAHLRAGRRRCGVPLSGEGRPGGGCRRRSCRRALGRLRDQAGQPLGGRRAQGICAGWPSEWRTATTARQPPLPYIVPSGYGFAHGGTEPGRDPHPCHGAVKRRRRKRRSLNIERQLPANTGPHPVHRPTPRRRRGASSSG